MSRIGKMPVKVPSGVKVNFEKNILKVEGPKGKMEQTVLPEVGFEIGGDEIIVSRKDESKKARSLHGLYRNLLNNMVVGVSSGFQRVLHINGVGYRAEVKGDLLLLSLGYSNQIEYVIPKGITISVEANTKVTVAGISKEQVGQVSTEIRSIRPPEPYKGKGVKFDTEVIRRKVGKSGVKK